MKKFSIPYNPQILKDKNLHNKYFDFLDRNKEYIKDIYFGYHVFPFLTDARTGHYESDNKDILADIHKIYRDFSIPGSATFNGEPVEISDKAYSSFQKAVQFIMNFGVDTITLNAPLWVENLNRDIPKLKIKNTVVNPIGHPQEIFYNYSEVGYDILFVREDLIKDRDTLLLDLKVRDICKKELAILMNHECCISFCPVKKVHYHWSNTFKDNLNFYKFCTYKETEDIPSWYKRTYVFPLREQYDWFYQRFDILKMAGRTIVADLEETIEIVDTYCQTNKSVLFKNWFQRLLKNIRDPKNINDFIKQHDNCKNMCILCGYCDRMIKNE